jgi:hypothetical protein
MQLRRLSIRCLLTGHEDLIRRDSDRMYLECSDCGRTTRGWTLGACRLRAFHRVSDVKRGASAFAMAA